MGEIVKVAKEIFPDVIIQICLYHYQKNISRGFKCDFANRKIKSLEKQLEELGDSILIPTHSYDLKKARRITNQIADLEYQYGDLINVQRIFQQIFWRAKDLKDLENLENELNQYISRLNKQNCRNFEAISARYSDYYEKRVMIIAFLKYPILKIPKTTNLIEGYNSTVFEIRFDSIRGFESEETAGNYINAMILNRRFQRFTDCKKQFKSLNGKSPLEISQPKNTFNFKFGSDDWIYFCQKLKKLIR